MGDSKMILFVAGFIALVVACFMFASSENSKAAAAKKSADDAMAETVVLSREIILIRKSVDELSLKLSKVIEIYSSGENDKDKLKQKVEWLEIKAQNTQSRLSAERLILAQQKPLQISLVYRQAKPKPKPLEDKEARETVIKNVKKKLKELSQ